MYRLNPLFIRSVFNYQWEREATHAILVSIPYSSGQCSITSGKERRRTPFWSQSLIHQVSVQFSEATTCMMSFATSQSLIHQVSVQLNQQIHTNQLSGSLNPLFIRSVFNFFPLKRHPAGARVSIPYSSGQCSIICTMMRFTRVSKSQSLIHQVSVQLNLGVCVDPGGDVSIPYSSGQCSIGASRTGWPQHWQSQSLIHQVSVQLANAAQDSCSHDVSIPYSSGQCSI